MLVSSSGLVTITGGKWTTYRSMGEDAVDRAAHAGGLEPRPSRTRTLPLHGHGPAVRRPEPWDVYGTDASALRRLAREEPALGEPLHPRLPYLAVQVAWAARREMARTVEDVLARRTRALLLDARASLEAAPGVADIMARELGRDATWRDRQVAAYATLVEGYLPPFR